MTLSRFRVSERQALHFIMAACVIGFVCAFLVVFLRRQATRTDTTKQTVVRWISPRAISAGNDLHHLVAELDDPSLMSLPDPRAFSGTLWRHQARIESQPIQPSNSVAYLEVPPPRVLGPLLPAASLPETVRAAAEKPEAAFVEPIPDGTAALPSRSAIQFDERLEPYRLLAAPPLPAIASETALRPTVVRLGIASDGTVVHAVLDRSCGNENADASALDAARQLRFGLPAETDRRSLLWGAAKFLWATKKP